MKYKKRNKQDVSVADYLVTVNEKRSLLELLVTNSFRERSRTNKHKTIMRSRKQGSINVLSALERDGLIIYHKKAKHVVITKKGMNSELIPQYVENDDNNLFTICPEKKEDIRYMIPPPPTGAEEWKKRAEAKAARGYGFVGDYEPKA